MEEVEIEDPEEPGEEYSPGPPSFGWNVIPLIPHEFTESGEGGKEPEELIQSRGDLVHHENEESEDGDDAHRSPGFRGTQP